MKTKLTIGILGALALAGCNTQAVQSPTHTQGSNVQSTDKELGDHILKTMAYVRSPLSPVVRQVTAQLLVNIANNNFESLTDKKDWVRILAIESGFDNSARSPVKATGIGQIMPQYAKEFGKACGMNGLQGKDLEDLIVNATISACVWHKMLDIVPERSVILALSAYNSGPSSTSTKNIQGMKAPVAETAGYITKFSYLKEVTEKK
jgi:soluble lytic murein transglycosylase-like protein